MSVFDTILFGLGYLGAHLLWAFIQGFARPSRKESLK